ncbi:hypothetical protein DR950_12955 [Kitasatospora xanthocidica]|uniref:Uncharacterized protein n=1 Tax=Kitasatospora xanthocidica TaxID=83382 RepID=A0A372ZRU0_9ACTN|nr:hypothetical protein [Kitasatospora xanthocidica]RGD58573.1 hypothetical protein DR950_12955 [Kitasatospora xanthocidica]
MTHRPSPWTRTGGALLAVAALAPAAAAWYVFTVVLPDDAERYRSYTAAVTCPAGSPGAAVEECVRTVPFTVSGTVVRNAGKSSEFRATLDGAPFWTGEVGFADGGPLLDGLKPGDRVDGTVWRGRVMRLERAGVAQASYDEPRDEGQFTAGVGTFAALLAVLAAVLGALRFTGRPGDVTLDLARSLVLWTLLACGVPAVLASVTGLPWWTVPAAAVPAALLAAEAVRRRNRGRTPGGPRRLPA